MFKVNNEGNNTVVYLEGYRRRYTGLGAQIIWPN